MSSVGRTVLGSTGRLVEVSADGKPENKTRGITIDWDTVVAAAAAVTLKDETPIAIGDKYLRYGQVLSRIGTAEVQTYTWTGGPTAGSAILAFPATDTHPAESTSAIAFNATAVEFAAALNALARFGISGATVARTGAGTAGDPYVYTVTYNRALGNVAQATATHTFTGGTTPTVTPATTTPGAGNGKFGPYNPAATDGRQTLSRGDVYILNRTLLESEKMSDHPEVIEGGRLWKERVLMTEGTASLALGPTRANVETYFPRVTWAE
jgi:hypothetical protein